MTSSDRDILIDIQSRLGKIELRLDGAEQQLAGLNSRVSVLEQNYLIMHEDIRVHNTRLEMGIWFTGICFAVLALVIAFVGMLAPKFWERFVSKGKPQPAPTPAPAPAPITPTVINIPQPQIDINAIARQIGEMFDLEPKPKR